MASTGQPQDAFCKGALVWYRHRSGAWMSGKVTFVDLSLVPPAYQVETEQDGMIRDTEGPRLLPRELGTAAPPAGAPPSAPSAAAPSLAAPSAAPSSIATTSEPQDHAARNATAMFSGMSLSGDADAHARLAAPAVHQGHSAGGSAAAPPAAGSYMHGWAQRPAAALHHPAHASAAPNCWPAQHGGGAPPAGHYRNVHSDSYQHAAPGAALAHPGVARSGGIAHAQQYPPPYPGWASGGQLSMQHEAPHGGHVRYGSQAGAAYGAHPSGPYPSSHLQPQPQQAWQPPGHQWHPGYGQPGGQYGSQAASGQQPPQWYAGGVQPVPGWQAAHAAQYRGAGHAGLAEPPATGFWGSAGQRADGREEPARDALPADLFAGMHIGGGR